MALPVKFLRTFLAANLLIAAGAGCPKNVNQNTDPDTNSGPDAKRGGAKVIAINKADTDSVSWPRLQRTKWKKIELVKPGVQDIMECILSIDNTGADLNIDAFNSLGIQIQYSPGPTPNKVKKLGVQIHDLGTYFVRIQAATQRDQSDFSVLCSWEEQPAQPVPPPPPVEPVKKPTTHKVRQPTEPVAQEETLETKVEKGTEGRIIQTYREGEKLILNLDKGSAAGIHQGTTGTVLVGKSGRDPLSGGTFKIIKVIDDGHSVAESDIKSLGKNNRIVLFLK